MDEPRFLELQPFFVGEVVEFVFHIIHYVVARAMFFRPKQSPRLWGDCFDLGPQRHHGIGVIVGGT